ncbi:hypothetical protein [Embleya sp. MST-111070]|uniref:hypothetical protein n=1 Tax=Embleya sp. MST-111070 TaxID=3398231 RepID=UPI003F737E39
MTRDGLSPRPPGRAGSRPSSATVQAGQIPVDQWPTRMPRKERTGRARQAEQARTVQDAVDLDRRRRREEAVRDTDRPVLPPRLGEAVRRRSLFLLPPDPDDEHGEPA